MIWLLMVPAVWCGLAILLDTYGRQSIPDQHFDAIVVPGCKVWKGGQPSNALTRRVQHAVSLYTHGTAPFIVLTGGVGTHAPAESEVAAQLACALGVPKTALLHEARSTTTRQNAQFAAQIVHEGQPICRWQVLVVSDAYHAWRCGRLFRRHFAGAVGRGSIPGWRLRIRGSLREVVSILLGIVKR